MANILLSLCIPTYNRCEVLEGTLESIFSDPDFHPYLIEVIVSDNCSNDQTASVVAKYPLVRYYCNEVNIHAYNFERVLDYARGKYIRIINDTFHFKKNVLGAMLENIEKHLNGNINLFFYPCFRKQSHTIKLIQNIDDLFENCSFYTMWSASTGFWREDYVAVKKGNKYTELLFPQLHWMYQIVRNGKNTLIYFMDMYKVQVLEKKGGYHFYKTFVQDYLSIVKAQGISWYIYEKEKYNLLKFHLVPWMMNFYGSPNLDFSFEKDKAGSILFSHYWYEPYFYPLVFELFVKALVKQLGYRIKALLSRNSK